MTALCRLVLLFSGQRQTLWIQSLVFIWSFLAVSCSVSGCWGLGGVLLAPPRQFVVIQTACSDCKAGVELCNKLVFSRRFAGVAM